MENGREGRRKRGWEGGREGKYTLLGNGKGDRKVRGGTNGRITSGIHIPVIVVTNHRDKDERLFKDVDTVR